jgi:hypothetical protein
VLRPTCERDFGPHSTHSRICFSTILYVAVIRLGFKQRPVLGFATARPTCQDIFKFDHPASFARNFSGLLSGDQCAVWCDRDCFAGLERLQHLEQHPVHASGNLNLLLLAVSY